MMWFDDITLQQDPPTKSNSNKTTTQQLCSLSGSLDSSQMNTSYSDFNHFFHSNECASAGTVESSFSDLHKFHQSDRTVSTYMSSSSQLNASLTLSRYQEDYSFSEAVLAIEESMTEDMDSIASFPCDETFDYASPKPCLQCCWMTPDPPRHDRQIIRSLPEIILIPDLSIPEGVTSTDDLSVMTNNLAVESNSHDLPVLSNDCVL